MTLKKLIKHHLHSRVPGFRGWFIYCRQRVFFPPKSEIFREACRDGIYEAALLNFMIGAVRDDTWFFDVGSNIGLFSVALLHANRTLRVASFEPSPNSMPYLTRTREASPFRDRWILVPKAAGATPGTATFSIGSPKDAGYDGLRPTHRRPTLKSVEVPVTTLDEEWARVGSPPVSVVKMDIEGGELGALNGAEELIRTWKPVICLEWYPPNFTVFGSKPEDLHRFASSRQYRVCSLPDLIPVVDSRHMEAMSIRCFAYALVPIG